MRLQYLFIWSILLCILGFAISGTPQGRPCAKLMVAVITSCNIIECQVQWTNGTFGKAKLPVSVGDMIEACP